MADIVFVLAAVAFFGVCLVYVRACDRLVRGGEEAGAEADVVEVTG